MLDAEIRSAFKSQKLNKHSIDCKIVDELNISCAGVRVDIGLINGYLHGYEIKSSNDTLNRLEKQLVGYSKVFDYITIVTEDAHLNKVSQDVPEWVGIILCTRTRSGSLKFKAIRKGLKNKNTDSTYVAKLLWRDELKSILDEYKIPYKSSERNWVLCEKISSSLNKKLISQLVRDKLKSRNEWKQVIT